MSDPAAPAFLSTANVGRFVYGVTAENGLVYVSQADPAMLQVVDFSDPSNPTIRGSAQVDQSGPVGIADALATVTAPGRVQFVDVGDPERPVALESLQLTGLEASAIASGILYATAGGLYSYSVRVEGADAPDLTATRLTVPERVQIGRTLSLDWTVRNQGREAAQGPWMDSVYLSTDARLDLPGDSLITEVVHNDPLNPLSTYNATADVPTAGLSAGTYFVIVHTDSGAQVDEAFVEGNNLRVSSRPVILGYADLAVTAVTHPAEVNHGGQLEVSWVVENLGEAPAQNPSWTDAVFLSTTGVLDGTEIPVGTVEHVTGLDVGQTYTASLLVDTSELADADYFVIVTSDVGAAVAETDEDNNTRVGTPPLNLRYPDLTVTHIAAPTVINRGDLIDVTWTVYNRSPAPAASTWKDELYLVDDPAQPQMLPLTLAVVDHTGGLDGRAVYHATAAVDTAAIADGNYWLAAKADLQDAVYESGHENNNLRLFGPIQIGVPSLTLGQPLSDTFDFRGQSKYYRVEVEAGQHLFVSLDDLNNEGHNELYLKYGSVPTRSEYDARYSANLAGDQTLAIATTQPGTYYILMYAESALDAPNDFALTANVLAFEILGVSPNRVGNSGEVTIAIRASRIAPEFRPKLLSPTGDDFLGTVAGLDETTVFARFDLSDAEPGDYDLILETSQRVVHITPEGDVSSDEIVFMAMLRDIVAVVGAGVGHLVAQIVVPSSVRLGRPFPIQIVYGNDGLVDVPAPLLTILAGQNSRLFVNEAADSVHALQLVGVSQTGPLGTLRPGVWQTVVLYGTGDAVPNANFSLQTTLADDTPLDFEALEGALRPQAPGDDWQDIWSVFVAKVGPTWRTLLRAIVESGTITSPLPGRGNSLYEALLSLLGAPSQGTVQQAALSPEWAAMSMEVSADPKLMSSGRDMTGNGYTWAELELMRKIMTQIAHDGSFLHTASEFLLHSLSNDQTSIVKSDTDEIADLIKDSTALERPYRTLTGAIEKDIRGMCTSLPDGDSVVPYTVAALNTEVSFYDYSNVAYLGLVGYYDLALTFGSARLKTSTSDGDRDVELSIHKSSLPGGLCYLYYSAEIPLVVSDTYEFGPYHGPHTVLEVSELDPFYAASQVLNIVDHSMYHLQQAGRASVFDSTVTLTIPAFGWLICRDEEPQVPAPPSGPGGDAPTNVVASYDPNDKTGPAGYGSSHFIVADAVMPYSIYYENDPEQGATAPAQVVKIEDSLESDLDLATFELGDINLYNSFWIDVPDGLQHYETLVDLRPEGQDLLVRVTAELDSGSRTVTWLFESLDPDTMLPPDDALAGFLPVNDKSLRNGEGHLSYIIRPLAGLPTGTQIANQALNYFDTNEAVPTPTTLHTIDAGKPISRVDELPAQVPDAPFTVAWGGLDDAGGSGIGSYTIYTKREDETEWNVRLKNAPETSADFTGVGGHRYGFRAVAKDNVGHVEDDPGAEEAWTFIDFSQLRVERLETTPSGFVAQFRRALDASVLNLYDVAMGTYGAADFTVVGATVGAVAGSLVYDPLAKTLSFVKTGGPLVPDAYTLTLRSAADGIRDLEGHLLDGDADGTEGGNYVTTVTVAPSAARVLSMPDFARGPGQPVNIPATGDGIPLTLTNGTGVVTVSAVLEYDPASLEVGGVTLGDAVPDGWSIQYNLGTPGRIPLTLHGTTPLPAGQLTVATVLATVPADAAYGTTALVSLRDVELSGGAIPAVGDAGVHVVAYLGDATGNARYSAMDAARIGELVGTAFGLAAYRTTDPAIVADTSGNRRVDARDATILARKIIGLPQPEIPDLPVTLPVGVPDGRPVRAPLVSNAYPGETITAPITIDDATGLSAFLLVIHYDTDLLDVDTAGVQSGVLLAGWNLDRLVDDAAGTITVSAYSTIGPISGGAGELLQITY